ncbi:hypothetical protein PtrSN002B_002269 [Pyrenophora tritici-repentis]|uniref:Uncharacterized protein n=2 Tax=Pyrenophora tritici-repentis TaxID=45151 RepID=A0A2W1I9V8_9PLEO|nr:uncharacterized protein PTRG_09958 [Pyrenophora tritici-repentis Pt-1C-BFP]KAA8621666.1 hypothetical protein PtrV1_06167 [Pyrenophora tritici-repentis]EDU43009.1 predicted protein [Pyrenophora tritici-repentis Pt-1C-BFP]KAF7450891.1 hypothetical protein A1F99_055070 [Pyrenophora tritici-repentis]KAF7573559.1 hypothetical protein PtrM4_084640 [Pyrenophora tritici-repentis]KAI0583673.1 hypothetical protein Alg215_03520 [Pyrenophora tritici-repentis]
MRFTVATLVAVLASLAAARTSPPGLPDGCTDLSDACSKGTSSTCTISCRKSVPPTDENRLTTIELKAGFGNCIGYSARAQQRYKKKGYCSPTWIQD